VRVRVLLSDAFTAETPDACPKCRDLVEAGRAYRNPPGTADPIMCESFVRVTIDGAVTVEECFRRWDHAGLHRSRTGATWGRGSADYQPAPIPDDGLDESE
jgi:hypothetical protein